MATSGREQSIRQASKMNTHLALRQAGNGQKALAYSALGAFLPVNVEEG